MNLQAIRGIWNRAHAAAPATAGRAGVSAPAFARGLLARLAAFAVCMALPCCASGQAPSVVVDKDVKRFDVLLAAKNGGQAKIGQVAVDTKYRLQIVSVVSKQKGFLTDTVEGMNSKTVLHAEAPPPKDTPRFANVSRVVERTSPEFFTELQAYLKQYYDLTLKPASK